MDVSVTACSASENAKSKGRNLNEGSGQIASGVPVSSAQAVWKVRSSDAHQAVAVDAQHVYAISNNRISKLNKNSGRTVSRWSAAATDSSIRHLNSAVVLGDRVYAAHSNWPVTPARNSVEVWDAVTLRPMESISMPGTRTWINWVDWYMGHWWIVLAHYNLAVPRPHDASIGSTSDLLQNQSHDSPNDSLDPRTRLLRMDEQFRVLDTWYFPVELLQQFNPMSNSGGSWGPNGILWLTGHSEPRAYLVRLPATGNTLEWTSTVFLPEIEGQGIAWDRSTEDPVLFGVQRSKRDLVKMRIRLSGE